MHRRFIAAWLSIVCATPLTLLHAQPADPAKQAESAAKAFETKLKTARDSVINRLQAAQKEPSTQALATAELDAFSISDALPSLAAKEADEFLECKRRETKALRDSLSKVHAAYQDRAELEKAQSVSEQIGELDEDLRDLEWTPWAHKVACGDKDDAGAWHRTKDGLELSAGAEGRGMFTVAALTTSVPSQIELTVRRRKGNGPLQLATRNALIIIDDNGASGIQMIDGKTYAENGTRRAGAVLSENPVTLRCTLQNGGIDVALPDGTEVLAWKGESRSLKLPAAVQAEMKSASFAVIGLDGDFVVESIRSKKLPVEKKAEAKAKPEPKARPKAPVRDAAPDNGNILPKDSEWDCQITINGKSSPAAGVRVTAASGDRRTVRIRLQNGGVYDVHVRLSDGSLELTGIPEHVRAANGGTRRTFMQLRGSGGSASADSMDLNFEATNNPPGGPQNELFRMRVSGSKR